MEDIKTAVRENYANVAKQGRSCCGPAATCGTAAPETVSKAVGYQEEQLAAVPEGANLGLGCGNPTALASLRLGETVLDLGSGAGFDYFLAANAVGAENKIIGMDITPEMIARARENARKGAYGNVEFRLGEIENLPVADGSVDVVISNCVINLAPDKRRVFQEAWRALRPGGRVMISDMVLLKPLPEIVRQSVEMYVGCIAGATLKEEYLGTVRAAGFTDVRILSEKPVPVALLLEDPAVKSILEQAHIPAGLLREADDFVASVTVEAHKPAGDSRQYFEQVAAQWDALQQSFFSEAVREKAYETADVKPGKLAADIGAGSGFITEGLLARGLRVIAVDSSAAMLAEMRKKFAGAQGVEYRLGEAQALPLADASVDYVFANMCLHHLESPADAIREMARVLKPGGRMVVTDLNAHKFEFLRIEHHDRWMGFQREDVRRWFREAGLADVAVDSVGQDCCASSACGSERASVSIFVASGQK